MRRRLFLSAIVIGVPFLLPITVAAASPFVPLADYQNTRLNQLYGTAQSLDPTSFGTSLNTLWIFAIVIAGVLAVLRLIQAGFLYEGGDFWDKKQKGKEIIQDVILGLLVLFAAWLILYQINPCILDVTHVFRYIGNGFNATGDTCTI